MFNKKFSPSRLGELEQGWWKAHHDHDSERMLQYLVDFNREFYGFDETGAVVAVEKLAAAAKFHDSRDWKFAQDAIEEYYRLVKDVSGLTFATRMMAELEIGWWKLHDDLEHEEDKTPLAQAFVSLFSEEFGIDLAKVQEAGRLKALATYEHDLAEDPTTPVDQVEAHWDKCRQALVGVYEELAKVLHIS